MEPVDEIRAAMRVALEERMFCRNKTEAPKPAAKPAARKAPAKKAAARKPAAKKAEPVRVVSSPDEPAIKRSPEELAAHEHTVRNANNPF